jgi:hypothetical protein
MGKLHPDPGQYQPRYTSVHKERYSNPVFFKSDRFLSKEIFPNTWLNKPELNIKAKTGFK